MPENPFEAIVLSPEPLNSCRWSMVLSIFSLDEMHDHDFRHYFFHREKFLLGFHIDLKFFSKDLFLLSMDLVALKIGQKTILNSNSWLGEDFWPNFALEESLVHYFGQKWDPVPNYPMGFHLCHSVPNLMATWQCGAPESSILCNSLLDADLGHIGGAHPFCSL
jgi:hypothetical protein